MSNVAVENSKHIMERNSGKWEQEKSNDIWPLWRRFVKEQLTTALLINVQHRYYYSNTNWSLLIEKQILEGDHEKVKRSQRDGKKGEGKLVIWYCHLILLNQRICSQVQN